MRVIIQRVTQASVSVNGKIVGEINEGIMALVGFNAADNEASMKYIIDKLINLRIFEDENDKMNLSVKDKGYGILIVPNFTLYGDARHGRRPSYTDAAPSDAASLLFSQFTQMCKNIFEGPVETGIFQADMQVSLINDGPVTILLDSSKSF